ncbi:hypothetical protein TEQG_02929 [Trichophyton equinum CBS 127.97]|uniref:Uncharacterized protein n=1 Tax=Trichophyton equinum (strain ATCC MYA-4606 / CBS 127.97) TaxID=559882 RepID=F2PPS8_TRIEC|nr:hypothetical protein TEQG_02929 [Trichophyton equinum CBS 127.97]
MVIPRRLSEVNRVPLNWKPVKTPKRLNATTTENRGKYHITRHVADQSTTRAFTILGRRGVRECADRLRGRVTRRRQLFNSLLGAGRINTLLRDRNPFLFPEDSPPDELNPPAETSSLCRRLFLRKISKPLLHTPAPSSPSSSLSLPSATMAMPIGMVIMDRDTLRVQSLYR